MLDDVQRFRDDFKRDHVGPHYRGALHFVGTNVGALAGIAVALSFVKDLRAIELITLPLTFLFANVVEYRVHRHLMHVDRPALRFLYARHTMMHHRYFVRDAMAATSTKDWKATLFPAPLILFFFGGIAAPSGFALSLIAPDNVAALFAATAVGYYLLYEWCHLAWHMPDGSFIGRRGIVRTLRALHRGHHDDMTTGFNVTFPIADAIFGTIPRSAGAASPANVTRPTKYP
jgi:hypothetical protein